MTHRYKFNAFVTALHESLQISDELKIARNSEFSTSYVDIDDENAETVLFQGYGRHTRDV